MFPNKQKRINEKDSIMEKAITLSFLIKRTLMPCLPVVCESDTAPNELNRYLIFSALAQKAGNFSGRDTTSTPNSFLKGTGP